MIKNRLNVPDFDLSKENISSITRSKPIILEKGFIPPVDFLNGEIFRKTDVYHYTKLSKTAYVYRAPLHELKKIYLEKYGNLNKLIGKDFHTKEAKKTFFELSKGIIPTEEEYYKHLIKVGSRFLYIGNNDDQFSNYLSFNITSSNPLIHHSFSNSILQEIVDKSALKPYYETKKCIAFNPTEENNIHPIAKLYLHQLAISDHNTEKIKELFDLGYTQPQIVALSDCSLSTVKRKLKKLNLSTKGHEKMTTETLIQKCKKDNPKWTQKQVAKYLNKGLRTIKRYW
jgi:hypothetical protein